MELPIIKKIEYSELDICAELIRESFGTVALEFHLTRQNCPTNGAFIETERLEIDWNKGNLMVGLYRGSVLAGFMELERKASDTYELQKLAVPPCYRHLGYGGLLLSYARKIAVEAHVSKITLGMIEENRILKNWYQSHGFRHMGIKKFAHLPFTVGFMEQLI